MKHTPGMDFILEALRQGGVNVGGTGGASGGYQGNVGSDRKSNIDYSVLDKMASSSRRFRIVAIIILILIAAGAYWWFHPAINIHSSEAWVFVSIFILFPLFLLFATRSRAYTLGTRKAIRSAGKAKTYRWLSYLPLIVIAVGLIGALASATFFPGNAAKYANLLQTDDLDFTQDIQEVDYSEIPVIDRDSAVLLGNRTMGSIPDFVSQFEVSSLYSQINYHGDPVRVSPLGYADIFKWFTNNDAGIPAYALVNMTTQDAQIVRLDNVIHYSQSELLARNIDRYVQLKYPFYMFDQKSFEIDEDGNPWWICPVQQRTIGLFGGTTISRVILCNATTGECQDLAVEDCPQWVDRVYPAELLIEQYNYSGALSSGWWNSWIGQSGVVQTTPGTNGQLGYNYIAKDDDVWVYTGVTSATADNSIVGFVLINQRTAESHFYSVAGATEESAMSSAEGQVQHLGYSATFPLLLNINGQPTYFMSLKDNAGLVKMYAMVDIQRYQNVAIGDTVEECQKSYTALLATNGVSVDGEEAEVLEASGAIARSTQVVIENNSHFYVLLEGDENIYDFSLPALLEIVRYAEGDSISFEYNEGDPVCTVTDITE